jgi:hypothetical protein
VAELSHYVKSICSTCGNTRGKQGEHSYFHYCLQGRYYGTVKSICSTSGNISNTQRWNHPFPKTIFKKRGWGRKNIFFSPDPPKTKKVFENSDFSQNGMEALSTILEAL